MLGRHTPPGVEMGQITKVNAIAPPSNLFFHVKSKHLQLKAKLFLTKVNPKPASNTGLVQASIGHIRQILEETNFLRTAKNLKGKQTQDHRPGF